MKNIVLIILDCWRYKHLTPELTPFIWGLGEKGARFQNHYTTAPWTLPSHASLFTGFYTREHGVEHENIILPDSIPTVAEAFQKSGYHTAAFSNNPWVGPLTNLDRGFEHFQGVWHSKVRRLPIGLVLRQKIKKVVMEYSNFLDYRDSGASKTNDHIWKWFDGYEGSPYFMFVNYMEVHHPYKPPEPYRSEHYKSDIPIGDLEQDYRKINGGIPNGVVDFEALEMLCQGEVAYIDSMVQELFEKIDDGNTIWIITSDHGDLLGEEGGHVGHRFSLHRNLLHVPLVIYNSEYRGQFNFLSNHTFLAKLLFHWAKDPTGNTAGRMQFPLKADSLYTFAEHTNPLPLLEQLKELKHFGPKFDVDKVNRDLVCVINKDGSQFILDETNGGISLEFDAGKYDFPGEDLEGALGWWQQRHKPIAYGKPDKPGLDASLQRLRDLGMF